MFRSFRFKIGLISVLLSSLLLIGFGGYAGRLLERSSRARVDRELRALADQQVRKSQPEGHWKRFDESLHAIYGEEASHLFLVRVTRPDGTLLYASPTWPADMTAPADSVAPPPVRRPPAEVDSHEAPGRPYDERAPRRPPPRPLELRDPVYRTLATPAANWRFLTLANEEVSLSIGMSLADLDAELRGFRIALLAAMSIGVLFIVAAGWLLGTLALRPVKVIARTAAGVTADRLDRRIPATRADREFQELIDLINDMLERLQRSFQQATRFSADAAHELKTPLAILQAHVERGLQRASDGTAEQRDWAEQLEEVQRLRTILQKLLLLAQADAGRLPLSPARTDLSALVRSAAEDANLLAPDRRITATVPSESWVMADAALLGQVLDNLVSNAVKFGDSGGAIDLTLVEAGGRVRLSITNTGAPIAAEHQAKLFERFFRADSARSRRTEGSGLGLSLSREIARAHGGDLLLRRSDPQQTAFELVLPLAP